MIGPDATQEYLFMEGNDARAWRSMGSHRCGDGYSFCVWAPAAKSVSVIGEFNHWDRQADPMKSDGHGLWTAYCGYARDMQCYRYAILPPSGDWIEKADPYALHSETRPQTASKLWPETPYPWADADFRAKMRSSVPYREPVSIYEVHLGSWRRDEQGRVYTYQRLADELIPYVKDMGFTHIELMPVMEHPLDASWGYQVTGYFSPTSRFGDPNGLKLLIDRAHQAGIGVILDWVPAHFPKDAYALASFDGTYLYEPANPALRENESWGTYCFDFEKGGVRSFLLSSALFWVEEYHADGLRVDAVSFMLHTDYLKDPNTVPKSRDGSHDNLGAIAFLKTMAEVLYREYPGILLCAEEATAYPGVTKPVYMGGLGFGFKWNMGWMHDVLEYMELDPIYRKDHHGKMTFSLVYAFSENYILPFSHDEVVHGKKSLIGKIPGDIDQKFASLRTLYGYMFAHPGKKLLFMGSEFAQFIEWKFQDGLDWLLLLYDRHPQMKTFVSTLNHVYTSTPPLYRMDDSWEGFQWLVENDSGSSLFAFSRSDGKNNVVAVMNFTPVTRRNYYLPMPSPGTLYPLLNSDDPAFGGRGETPQKPGIECEFGSVGHMSFHARIDIAGLSVQYYRYQRLPWPPARIGAKDK